tara:strand:- start:4187 stop:4783 length:597 start_codon:yes stop_codon:yes gene_type:complete
VLKNPKDRILDMGCGQNPYYQAGVPGKFVCLDIRKTTPAHVVSDANKLPFRANSFDKVISVNLLYYLKNPFDIVSQLHRLLKKNGKLILVLPFFYPIHDAPEDRYRFTEYGIRTLLQGKFKIERISTIGGIFNLPAVILHSLMKGLPLIAPEGIKGLVKILAYVLYPFYLIAQLFSILDVLDRTERFPTYYFVVAAKK